jgi:uncharacterized membrane protein YfcA
MQSAAWVALVALVFLLAGGVKGVVGLGLPTVSMGVLGLFMPPAQAAAMLVVPSLVTNLWQLLAGPAFGSLLRRFGLMMAGVFAGTAAGIGFLTSGSTKWPSVALGAVLVLYALISLFVRGLSVPARFERVLSPIVGIVTGLLTGATGIFVVPAVPYLGALGLGKDELIQALGLSFTVSTLALAACLVATSSYSIDFATQSALAVIPALAGMFLGQAVRDKLNAQVFRQWFFWAMLTVGVFMVVRALWGSDWSSVTPTMRG